jgi:WD40 repeat protein
MSGPFSGADAGARRPSFPSPPASDEPRPPPRVSDHELLCRIGGGSYGEVWLARSLLGNYRAVKAVYRTDFEDDRPFEREFAGIKRFEPISRLHESQVDILHVGRAADCFYYVMELADDQRTGQQIDPEHYLPRTLRSEIQARATLPLEECLSIALALTTALEQLHSHHLVHRDIKPSNIIFVSGAAKLADIGLVTGVDATRSYVGTEGFIPPEGAGTPQGDFYSLGKVLYEVSTGKDRQDFPETPAGWDGTPGERAWLEFHEVVLKACEPDPRRRYQSAPELRAELEVLRGGKSVRRLRAVERRLAALTRLGLAASVLLLVAACAYLFSVHEAHLALKEAQRADREAARAKVAEHQALERLGDSYLAQAQARRMSGLAGQRFDSLEALGKAAEIWPSLNRPPLVLRNEAIACLALADFQTPDRWHGVPPDTVMRAFSPTFEYYAYATDKGDVSIRRVADETEFLHFPGAGVTANGDFKFSPDGRWLGLFYGSKDLDMCIWGLDRRSAALKTTGLRGRCLSFSSDSQSLALGQHDGPILIYDLSSGRCIHRLEQRPLPYSLAFSPDGRQLAVSTTESYTVQVRDVVTGAVLQSLAHPSVVRGLAWHPAGNLLATACNDHDIWIWDVATGTARSVLAGHQSQVLALAYSHGGEMLVSSSWDQTMRLWDTVNSRLMVTKRDGCACSLFGPADRCLGFATGSELMGICQVARGLECRHLYLDPKLTGGTVACEFSRDGQHLVSAHNDGLRVWDLATGTQASFLPEREVRCVVFAPESVLFTLGAGGLKKWTVEPATFSSPCQVVPPAVFGNQPVEDLSLAADGRAIVANPRGNVSVFDTAGRLIEQQLPGDAIFNRLALSPDGHWVAGATSAQTSVRIWSLQETNVARDLPCQSVSCLAFTQDGQRLITGSYYDYRIWDTHSWQCVFVTPRAERGGNTCVACAPAGQLMAVTTSAESVRLLDSGTGRELATFGMPEPQVISALAFSPDGQYLAVCGQTPIIYIWDLRLIHRELANMKLAWD